MQYYLGIDIGTGSTKAVALSTSGQVLHATQEFYAVDSGHAVQDPMIIWEAFCSCIYKITLHFGVAPHFVSLSSAMHSIMAVDKNGAPLSPLLTWADDRAAYIAENLLSRPEGSDFYAHCGTPVHALSPLCKIRWWYENDPHLHNMAARFIGVKEWVWFQLFGEFEIDYSLASATGMFDLNKKEWYAPALFFAGINAAKLSQPVDTTFCRKSIRATHSALDRLRNDTLFVIGASDGCLANMGTAALQPGTAAVTIGTSGAVRVASRVPKALFPVQLFNYYLYKDMWITGGAINNGGAAVQWISQILGNAKVDDAFMEQIALVAPGSDGLIFLPMLLGERAPVWDSNSSAAFIGLRQQHSHQHLLRAVVEGICFALRSVLDPLEKATGTIGTLHLSGGFAKSGAALQVLADCLGKKIVLLQTEDASAIGAVLLGSKALFINMAPELHQTEGFNKTFLPSPAAHERYNHFYAVYKTLYPMLKSTMHQLRQWA